MERLFLEMDLPSGTQETGVNLVRQLVVCESRILVM